MEWLKSVFEHQGWLIQIAIVFLLTIAVYLTEVKVYQRLYKRAEKTKQFWDDALLKAAHAPLVVIILLVGFSVIAKIAAISLGESEFISTVMSVKHITLIVVTIWFLVRLVSEVEVNLAKLQPSKFDRTTVYIISRLIRVSVGLIGLLMILQSVGIPISGLLAFGGGGAIVVGLAAKDVLANFFGGMMIFLDKPFKIGDWVNSPDRNIEGTVEQIGWRLTCIRAFDKRPMYIPNSIFSNIVVKNPSRMSHRQINKIIGVRYDDALKVRTIVNDVKTMLDNHPDIDQIQTKFVNLVNLGPSALEFKVYCFTKTTNWVAFQAIQEDVLLKIIDIVDQHNAQVAFPTTTIHIPEEVHVQQGVEANL